MLERLGKYHSPPHFPLWREPHGEHFIPLWWFYSNSNENSGWFNKSTEVFLCAHGPRANTCAWRVGADGR